MKQGKKQKNGIIGGLFWSFGERIAAQLVTTLVTIVLARLLDPEHYGVIAIVTVLISFLNVFVEAGFGSALIQNKDSKEIDFNTAFLMSFSLSVFLYTALFFLAPTIANFYDNPSLTAIIRVLGVRLIVASINSIQQAHIRKRMEFKRFFWATFIGTVASGVIGIFLAYIGFGVWALVAQYLTNVTIDTFMLFIVGSWKPKIQFSRESAKKTWSFGWKVLATTLVYTIEGDIRSLIVGKVYGPSDLSYYDQGKKYPSLLMTNINSSIQKVMLPAYSSIQDDNAAMLMVLRKSIRIGFYILAPLLIGFALVANNFVSIFLTDKWLPCVPYIQIFCLSFLTRPLESSCHQAILAKGRSGLVLITMIIIHLFGLASVIVSVFVLNSVLWIALFSLFTTLVSCVTFFYFVNKLFNYKLLELAADLLPSFAVVTAMGVIVFFVGFIQLDSMAVLAIQIVSGVFVYFIMSYIFRLEPFVYLRKKISGFLKHKI